MKTFPELLLSAIKSSGVTRADLAKQLGYERAQITNMVKGRRKLDLQKIDIAAEFLGLEGEARAEFVMAAHLAHASEFTQAAMAKNLRQLAELQRLVRDLRDGEAGGPAAL